MPYKTVHRKLLFKPKKTGKGDTEWEQEEEELLRKLLSKGLGPNEIGTHFENRSSTSLKSKIQKFKIKYDIYGLDDRSMKVTLAKRWLALIKPNSVFEGFAGLGSLTKLYIESGAKKIYACEIDKKRYRILVKNVSRFIKVKGTASKLGSMSIIKFLKNGQIIYLANCNAERLASHLYFEREYFDLVDLDPCGTTLPSMTTFLKIISNGYLEATYGEFHSYRLGRIDVMLKAVPTIFNYSVNGVKMKEMKNIKELYRHLISWTCLQGAATLDYRDQRFVNPLETHTLGRRNMMRVLYKVERSKSLAKILNKSISIIKN